MASSFSVPRLATAALAATVTLSWVTPSSVSGAVISKEICADYLGVVQCVVVTTPAPKSPSTTPGMQAVASPSTVAVDGTVTVTAGGRLGGRGYTAGEIVRLFEFWKGNVTELTGTKFADKSGTITFKREYLSLVGVNTEGPRTLCARGERSLRIACTNITVGTGGSATTVPSQGSTSGPTRAKSSKGMKGVGSRHSVTPGQTTKITFGPSSGQKGFTPGEKVVVYDFLNGSRTTVDTSKANKNGSVTVTVGWSSGSTVDGTHELCSYGQKSGKMACYSVETGGFTNPGTTTAPATTIPATTVPKTTLPPTTTIPATTVPRTTLPPYGPPVAG